MFCGLHEYYDCIACYVTCTRYKGESNIDAQRLTTLLKNDLFWFDGCAKKRRHHRFSIRSVPPPHPDPRPSLLPRCRRGPERLDPSPSAQVPTFLHSILYYNPRLRWPQCSYRPFARGTFVYGLNVLVHRRGRQHRVFFSALDPLLRTMSAVVIIQLTTYYRLFARKTLRSLLTIQRTSFRIIVGAFSRFSPGTIRRVYGRCPRLFAAFSQRSDAPLDYTYTILWIAGHFRDLFLLMVLVYSWILSVGRWYLPVHHLTLKNDW